MRVFSVSLFFVIFNLLCGCVTPAPQDSTREPAAENNLNYAKFIDLLQKYQPKSVEDTLKLLSEKYPDYLSFHTFVYQSFSLQGSSLKAPRALVFGRDSKLVMSFNEGEDLKGHDTIEVMRFKNETKEFEFREIQFSKDKTKLTEEEIDPSLNFAISPANGQNGKCLMCHSQPARPNWDPYPFWPGIYGSHSDFENFSSGNGTMKFEEIPPSDSSYKERQAYLSFMANERNQGRYKYLPAINEDLRPEFSGDLVPRVNLLFTNQLNSLNAQKIVQNIKNDPKLYRRRYAIVEAILCDKMEFGKDEYNQLSGRKLLRPLTPMELFVQRRLESTKASRAARYKDVFGTSKISRMGLDIDLINIATAAKLVEIAGLDTVGNWSLSLGADSLDFSTPVGGPLQNSLKTFVLPEAIRVLTPEFLSTKAYDPSKYPSLSDFGATPLAPICIQLAALDKRATGK